MSAKTPRIAVLMAACNAETTIKRTLASLNANEEPHDIVIVDDGSLRPLQEILPPQANVKILRMDKNVGITRALNHGMRYILDCDYEFVARMDADDEASSDRLKLQVSFLDKNPDIVLVGGCGEVVSETGETLFYLNHPTDFEAILKSLYYNSCFLHPTLMMRVGAMRAYGLYDEHYPNAEDYELVRRLSRQAKLANLPQYLIRYTVSTRGLSVSKRRLQLRTRFKVQWTYRNFGTIHFYCGILKTAVLWFMPMGMIMGIKQRLDLYKVR